MDVQVGDVIQTKKPHPCGANRFDVLRVGMDFKIRCQGCGHEIMLPRAKIERNIKKVLRGGDFCPPQPDTPKEEPCSLFLNCTRSSAGTKNWPIKCPRRRLLPMQTPTPR